MDNQHGDSLPHPADHDHGLEQQHPRQHRRQHQEQGQEQGKRQDQQQSMHVHDGYHPYAAPQSQIGDQNSQGPQSQASSVVKPQQDLQHDSHHHHGQLAQQTAPKMQSNPVVPPGNAARPDTSGPLPHSQQDGSPKRSHGALSKPALRRPSPISRKRSRLVPPVGSPDASSPQNRTLRLPLGSGGKRHVVPAPETPADQFEDIFSRDADFPPTPLPAWVTDPAPWRVNMYLSPAHARVPGLRPGADGRQTLCKGWTVAEIRAEMCIP